jgi:F-type H+-transporting ATPase subunit epsilon
MSQKKLHLTITTPLRTVYDSDVDQLTVTTSVGEITILPDHVPLVIPLVVGKVMVKKENHEIYHTIDGGILEVRHDNQVVILSDRSEDSTEIDLARAQEALDRAQKHMEESKDGDTADYNKLEQNIAKELNRVKFAKKDQRK